MESLRTSLFYVVCSLIQHYPRFEERLRKSLRMLIGNELESKVEIGLAKDGSGVGGTCRLFLNSDSRN